MMIANFSKDEQSPGYKILFINVFRKQILKGFDTIGALYSLPFILRNVFLVVHIFWLVLVDKLID